MMNEYQEALDNVYEELKRRPTILESRLLKTSKPLLQELVDKVPYYKELEDKATPKKVIGKGSDYVACPKCFIHLSYDKKTELGNDYCDTCGQAIDWSNDE